MRRASLFSLIVLCRVGPASSAGAGYRCCASEAPRSFHHQLDGVINADDRRAAISVGVHSKQLQSVPKDFSRSRRPRWMALWI